METGVRANVLDIVLQPLDAVSTSRNEKENMIIVDSYHRDHRVNSQPDLLIEIWNLRSDNIVRFFSVLTQ